MLGTSTLSLWTFPTGFSGANNFENCKVQIDLTCEFLGLLEALRMPGRRAMAEGREERPVELLTTLTGEPSKEIVLWNIY